MLKLKTFDTFNVEQVPILTSTSGNFYRTVVYIGDYLVFAEENENVVVWGILKSDLRIEDPVVYQGQEYNGKYSWYSEDSTFSRFVIQMFKWQRGIE